MKKFRVKGDGKSKLTSLSSKAGRPSTVPPEILKTITDVIESMQLTGTVASRRRVISIGKGCIKAFQALAIERMWWKHRTYGSLGSLKIVSLNMVRHRGTTPKLPIALARMKEMTHRFQKKIATVLPVVQHQIPKDLVLEL